MVRLWLPAVVTRTERAARTQAALLGPLAPREGPAAREAAGIAALNPFARAYGG